MQGVIRGTLAGLSLVASLAEPEIEDAVAAGVLTQGTIPADLLTPAVTALTGSASRAAAATSPGPVRPDDVDRVTTWVKGVLRNGLIDLQAKTLDRPFIDSAEQLLRKAAESRWSKAQFRGAMDQLADRWGATTYDGSYADTWYETVILNASYNRAVATAYSSDPTSRLFPFIAFRTAGDDQVRPEHQALDGFVARSTWEFWPLYTPPLGWNCRCRVVPVAFSVAKALGWLGQEFPRGSEFLAPRAEGNRLIIPGRSPGFGAPL